MPEKDKTSRLRAMLDKGIAPEFPPIEAHYLVSYLMEIGPLVAGSALTAQEILAWLELTGIELQPWESRFLLSLSRDYLVESSRAVKRDCQPPYGGLVRNPNINTLIDKFLE